ncbi:MAG: hypothetical protein Q8L37_05590 [Candidatus Gottesmanbacteria bacterium]|nr:hypothetical protein [Candidatus Gottesmanbacteria bacterium]
MKEFIRSPKPVAGIFLTRIPRILMLIIFILFSSWLMFHTFGYDGTSNVPAAFDGGSAQKDILVARMVWSDFGSHIPLIRSFSMGDNFDRLRSLQSPEYPLFSGEPIRYHFLFYALVGLLEKSGLRLDWALNIPSILGFTLLLAGIWSLAIALFKDTKVAVLSVIFFLFNGSLSFLKFFKDHPLSLNTPLDITSANAFPAFGPWDGGMITAFWNLNIYTNQRHLGLAFGIILLFVYWITRKSQSPIAINPKHQIPSTIWNLRAAFSWGLIIGLFPYFHQPSLLIFAVLLIWYFLAFPRLRKTILMTALTATLLILPQIMTTSLFRISNLEHSNLFGIWKLVLGASSVWFPGYLIFDRLTITNFLSFWFANLGLHSLLIPIGFFLLPNRAKKVLVPLFLLFVIGNVFKFSVEVAANHKFFNFALILGNMITAYTIVSIGKYVRIMLLRMKSKSPFPFFIGSICSIGSICLLVVFLTLSGFIDFFVVFNDAKGPLADVGSPRFVVEAGNNQTASWIAANTPRDAVFLNSSFLYHPASLAGRKIFMGWPYFAWSAGYDTYKRNDEMKVMYESRDPAVFCPLLKQYNISYVTVEDTKGDPNLPAIDPTYFRDHYEPVFEQTDGALRIYQTTTLCPGD